MTIEEFKKQVKQEIDNIKTHATKEEIGKLDFETLKPEDEESCIYGQMTGDCQSERAHELIKKCYVGTYSPFENLENIVYQGVPRKYSFYDWSQLEYFIMTPDSPNKEIIQYLKGETKTLEL